MRHLLTGILLIGTLLDAERSRSQVFVDFEDGDISQWLVEADGVPSLSANGNPGQCLRIDDEAINQINYVVAPWSFTGNWQNSTATDSITFDLFAHRIANTPLGQNGYPLIIITGPGGTATTLVDVVPEFEVWQRIAVSLDSNDWNVTGHWNDIIATVHTFKIRTEFITGDEWVLLDNIRISHEPIQPELTGTTCSNWNAPGNLDGWSFQNVSSIQISTTQGNPPGSVRLGDAGGAITYAVAAPKFRGDWSGLDGLATMRFDLFLQTNSSNFRDKEYLVKISGPGGSARFNTNDSLTALNVNQWRTYEIPITPMSWDLLTGTWPDLLELVSEIRLELEFINTTNEVCFLDNFCLETGINTGAFHTHGTEAFPMIFPNPTSGEFSISLDHITGRVEVQVWDCRGRQVGISQHFYGSDHHAIDLSGHTNGLYMVRIITESGGVITKPIMLQQ